MKNLLIAMMLIQVPVAAQVVSFDRLRLGPLPKNWSVDMTHEGGAPRWEILEDPSSPGKAHVLAQTSTDNTSGRFPLAILQGKTMTNGTVSVRFKPVAGERDQAGGIVWRYKDANNYYVVRANALEDNVVLYKVDGGNRISLEPRGTPSKTYGVKQRIPKHSWSELSVSFQGPRFEVSFDGNVIMTVEDHTFAGAGKTGLWTKADSVVYFDRFRLVRAR